MSRRRSHRGRSLGIYLLFLAAVLILGYGSRRYGFHLEAYFPKLFVKRIGDALWASAIFVLLTLIYRKTATFKLATAALIISFAIEFSQMYHAPWIDSIRSYALGGMILGNSFFWWDLAAYVVGVTAAAAVDLIILD